MRHWEPIRSKLKEARLNVGSLILGFLFLSSNSVSSNLGRETNAYNQQLSGVEILVFISPHCPICQKYTARLNEIDSIATINNIQFKAIISGRYFNQIDVYEFETSFGSKFEIEIDTGYAHAKIWNATVTPEVIFHRGKTVFYRGMIDNWFYKIGRSSNKTTEHYLLSALEEFINKGHVSVESTKPVGCILE